MRVVLRHNPAAGGGEQALRELTGAIQRAGHTLVGHASDEREMKAALAAGCDLVAIAGGDGTVHATLALLAGTGVPFAILPAGTANNIAKSLGFQGDPATLVAGWAGGGPRPIDRGVARRGDRVAHFIESLGFGVFPEVIRRGESLPKGGDALDPALKLFAKVAAEAPARRYAITADGQDLSGEYLLVEAMNLGLLGPNVSLAHSAPDDGRVELVLLGEADRGALVTHIEALRAGRRPAPPWRTCPVHEAAIATEERRFHEDDQAREDGGRVHISTEPGALVAWRPAA